MSPLTVINLNDLFTNHQDKYVIPIYQRNYAWGEAEIEQLLRDLLEATKSGQPYFLGSLIVQEKGKSESGKTYEVIDGQQRLTTLFLLNECWRLLYSGEKRSKSFSLSFESRKESTAILNKLKELSSLEGNLSVERLLKTELQEESKTELNLENHTIIEGIATVERFLITYVKYDEQKPLSKQEQSSQVLFIKKNEKPKVNAYLLRAVLPSHIDKNHYFEKMNTRSVQLEAHELLKAKMMRALKGNNDDIALFSLIWDACSDMSRFAVSNSKLKQLSEQGVPGRDLENPFLIEIKAETFNNFATAINDKSATSEGVTQEKKNSNSEDGVQEQKNPNSEDGGQEKKSVNTEKEEMSINEIFDNLQTQTYAASKNEEKDAQNKEGRYQSIINFPNFLLQVLTIYKNKDQIRLDDKFLLEEFDCALKMGIATSNHEQGETSNDFQTADEIKAFAMHLLKMRLLFDCYILKIIDTEEDEEEKWGIWSWKAAESKNHVDTFKDLSSKEILQLQSMLHVSFNTQTYKKWLLMVLCFLNNESKEWLNPQTAPTPNFTPKFKKELEKIAAELFQEQYPHKDSQKSIKDILKRQSYPNFTHYTFNYLDYLIWKDFNLKNQGELEEKLLLPKKCNESAKLKTAIEDFKFKHRSSVEHYYPQNSEAVPKLQVKEEKKINPLHSLGNLCLISAHQNVKLSNSSPDEKRKEVLLKLESDKKFRVDSAKQALMMMYDEWNSESIKDHQEIVLERLERELTKIKNQDNAH